MIPQIPYPIINRKVSNELRLAQFRPNQAPALFALVDKNRTQLRKRHIWVDRQRNVTHTQDFIMGATQVQRENGAPTAGLWEGPNLIGVISLHLIDWSTKTAMLGYWLDSDYEGQEIMTKAISAMSDFAVRELGLEHIELGESNHSRSR